MEYHDDDPDMGYSDEEVSSKKRKVVQACDACRKKKIKCDGNENLECSNCKSKEISCIFTPTSTKRGPRQGYIENLEKRLELMEKLLQPLKDIEIKTFQTPNSGELSTISEEFLQLTSDSSNNAAVLATGISGTCNTNIRDIDQYLLPDSSVIFPSIPPLPTPATPDISPEVSEHLISLYFTYIHPLLPIFHQTTFINSFKDNNQCPLLLYTIYALASRFSSHPEVQKEPRYFSGEECISHVKILLESSSYSTPYLTTVQALILVSLHELGCDRYPTAWMYSGLAVRMGQHLNLYCTDKNEASSKLDWIEAETRRRTWFGCCLMDRLLSTKTSWPMAIHDEDCQVKFPSEDFKWENSRSFSQSTTRFFQSETNHYSTPVPEHMFQFGSLISIMGKVNHYSNRSTNFKKTSSTAEELLDLDNLLQLWHMELPPHLQYSPEFLNSYTPENIMTSSAILMLHSLYNAINIVLHRSNIGRFLSNNISISDVETSVMRCEQSACFLASTIDHVMPHRFFQYIPFYSYALYTAGSIYANEAFSSDYQQSQQARYNLEKIYNTLNGLETYWGICRTYCISLKGLFVLRSSRNVSGNNSNSALLNKILNWLVPQKSSLHDWFSHLEKLSKEVGESFWLEKVSASQNQSKDQPTTPVISSDDLSHLKSSSADLALMKNIPLNSNHSATVFNQSAAFVDQSNFPTFPAAISTGFTNTQPATFNDVDFNQLMGFEPNNQLLNSSFEAGAFDFNFNMPGNSNFMQDLNTEAFFNLDINSGANDVSSQQTIPQSQPSMSQNTNLSCNYGNPL